MDKPAPTEHPIHDLLQERWSPRSFADRPVEENVLLSLFEAARWAPSSFNAQPWVFFVARRSEQEEWHKALECLVPGNQEWAEGAPVLVLTAIRTNHEKNGKPNRVALKDLGLAVANLTVATLSCTRWKALTWKRCATPTGCRTTTRRRQPLPSATRARPRDSKKTCARRNWPSANASP